MACMIQFLLHVMGRFSLAQFQEEKLKIWCKRNKVKLRKQIDFTDIYLKMEIVILTICITGYIHEMVFVSSLASLFKPEIRTSQMVISWIYARVFVLILEQDYYQEWKVIIKSAYKIVERALPYMLFYFLMIIVFSLSGYYLFSHEEKTANSAISFNGFY